MMKGKSAELNCTLWLYDTIRYNRRV